MTLEVSAEARKRIDEASLVTGNPDKVLEAERILGFPIRHLDVDLPEIQSASLMEVAVEKAGEAWERARRPVIVEETGLDLASLNGFPGPLVKWMLDSVGPEGIARTAHALGDPRATARCILLLRDGDEVVSGESSCPGDLVLPARGEEGFGWDPVFSPEGSDFTYAELGVELKDRLGHRGQAWRDLLRALG